MGARRDRERLAKLPGVWRCVREDGRDPRRLPRRGGEVFGSGISRGGESRKVWEGVRARGGDARGCGVAAGGSRAVVQDVGLEAHRGRLRVQGGAAAPRGQPEGVWDRGVGPQRGRTLPGERREWPMAARACAGSWRERLTPRSCTCRRAAGRLTPRSCTCRRAAERLRHDPARAGGRRGGLRHDPARAGWRPLGLVAGGRARGGDRWVRRRGSGCVGRRRRRPRRLDAREG
jgi:hypothetical protein